MSNRIADYRRIRGMSPDDLSDESGLSKSTLSGLERGITQPTLDHARRIANALDAYEHEIWPEDLTACGVGDELTAAKARIADLESDKEKTSIGHLSALKFLSDRIAELEKALEPFAELGESYDESFADDDEATFADDELTVGDLRRAGALLNQEGT